MSRHLSPRARFAPIATLLTASLSLAFLMARPVSAHAADALCQGTYTIGYSPGITNTPQTVTTDVDGQLTCVSATDPLVRAAETHSSARVVRACTSLLTTTRVTQTLDWNTGEHSTLDLTIVPNYAAGQLVLASSGTVSAGKFRGSLVTGTDTLLGDFADCSTSGGLTQLSGPATIAIL